MSAVIGIDPDARQLAYALVEGSTWDAHSIARTTKTGDFFAEYERGLVALMRDAQSLGAMVYLEDVFLALAGEKNAERRNVRTYRVLCEVQGEIRYEARRHGVPVVNVRASEWRAAVLGQTANRDAMKALARARAERDCVGLDLTEHECEAVCIAEYGVMEHGK